MNVKDILSGFLRKINSVTGLSAENLTDAVTNVTKNNVRMALYKPITLNTQTHIATINIKTVCTQAGYTKEDITWTWNPYYVNASELVSGTYTATENGRHDITNYQYVDVTVGDSPPRINIESMEVLSDSKAVFHADVPIQADGKLYLYFENNTTDTSDWIVVNMMFDADRGIIYNGARMQMGISSYPSPYSVSISGNDITVNYLGYVQCPIGVYTPGIAVCARV